MASERCTQTPQVTTLYYCYLRCVVCAVKTIISQAIATITIIIPCTWAMWPVNVYLLCETCFLCVHSIH